MNDATNEVQDSANAETGNVTAAANAGTVPFEFRFKKINAAKLKEHIENDVETEQQSIAKNCFEPLDDKGTEFRRKPETHNLQVPEFYYQIPTLAQQQILKLIADFVKTRYIDQYLTVGDHSWEYIEQEAAKTGGRTPQFEFSDEAFAKVQQIFQEYVSQGTGNEQVGERFAAAVKSKFTKAAISKNIGEFSEAILQKLESWVTRTMEHCSEVIKDQDELDSILPVFEFLLAKLDKHLKESESVNPAEFL